MNIRRATLNEDNYPRHSGISRVIEIKYSCLHIAKGSYIFSHTGKYPSLQYRSMWQRSRRAIIFDFTSLRDYTLFLNIGFACTKIKGYDERWMFNISCPLREWLVPWNIFIMTAASATWLHWPKRTLRFNKSVIATTGQTSFAGALRPLVLSRSSRATYRRRE